MKSVALIFIFNHQYNKNIDILEKIYSERFSNIFHLVPFYNGDKKNVIPVYDSSYCFQGYVAQSLQTYFNEKFKHYLFVADDLIIDPAINENNYKEHFQLGENTCFIPLFETLHTKKEWWPRMWEAFHYDIKAPGVEANGQLPDSKEALTRFHKFGLDTGPLKFKNIWNFGQVWRRTKYIADIDLKLSIPVIIYLYIVFFVRFLYSTLTNKKYKVPYPIVGSYSDIFVVSADSIKEFCHYCGVFSATKLFVELAIPTAMVLSAKEIVTEKDLKHKGKLLWSKKDFEFLDKYEYKLSRLLNDFPKDLLYIHSIKLSKWDKQ